MPRPQNVNAAVRRGLAFLQKRQEADGSFTSGSSARMRPFRRTRSWRTVFVPALMLCSLAGLEEQTARRIRQRLAAFLLTQKDGNWSFNYWTKDSPDRKIQPYPNDLDDTFCALAGLYLHDPSIIDEEALSKIIKLLLAAEAAVGGPYRTWLVPPGSEPVWLDVDMAVNSNIAYFLSLVSNGVPSLDRLIGEAVRTGSFQSPYYPSEYAFIYYFARSYRGEHRARLLSRARKPREPAVTDLDRALCISSRLKLGETRSLSASVDELLAGQRPDGSWPAAAFYADPVKDGKLYYNGGSELTTAFALEALGLYRHAATQHTVAAAGNAGKDKVRAAVLASAEKQCRSLAPDLRGSILGSLAKLADSDNGADIISLAHRFNASLIKPLATPGSLLDNLGLANLYGWLAYTIYDDLLDGEGGTGLLPAANAAMRRSLDCFLEALPDNREFRALARRTFDDMDGANAWEQANCRFAVQSGYLVVGRLPDYGAFSKLAERSLGHTLPPLAILAAKGLDLESRACRQIALALRHYLIVRQLNDDTHDWPEDLQKGRITPVVARLLRELGVTRGRHTLAELTHDARRQFWNDSLPGLCDRMRKHLLLSRQALERSGLLEPVNVIAGLLDGMEASISDTLAKQGQAGNFLKYYRRGAVKL